MFFFAFQDFIFIIRLSYAFLFAHSSRDGELLVEEMKEIENSLNIPREYNWDINNIFSFPSFWSLCEKWSDRFLILFRCWETMNRYEWKQVALWKTYFPSLRMFQVFVLIMPTQWPCFFWWLIRYSNQKRVNYDNGRSSLTVSAMEIARSKESLRAKIGRGLEGRKKEGRKGAGVVSKKQSKSTKRYASDSLVTNIINWLTSDIRSVFFLLHKFKLEIKYLKIFG